MGGIRSKLVVLLIMYFAGFATAIYTLAPVPQGCDIEGKKSLASRILNSDEFAQSLNARMHEWIKLGNAAAAQAGNFVQEKADRNNNESGG